LRNLINKLFRRKTFDEYLNNYKDSPIGSQARRKALNGMRWTANTNDQWSNLWGKSEAGSEIEKIADHMMGKTSAVKQ